VVDDAESRQAPWLTPEQLQDWVAVMGLVMTLPASLDAQLRRDTGLNLFEYHVLVELAEADQGVRVMSDLATHTRGSLSRLSHAVSRLEAAGWVIRRACGGAGRRTEAQLTPAGREKLEQSAPGHVREARRLVIDALTAEELHHLGAAARRIVAVTAPEIAATLPTPQRSGPPPG
jgi:DNA-binding MarR family transcriptional regulator